MFLIRAAAEELDIVPAAEVAATIACIGAPLADIPFKNVLFVAQVCTCVRKCTFLRAGWQQHVQCERGGQR